jgi:hypothetical protein
MHGNKILTVTFDNDLTCSSVRIFFRTRKPAASIIRKIRPTAPNMEVKASANISIITAAKIKDKQSLSYFLPQIKQY